MKTEDMKVIAVSGTPHQRGKQIGASLCDDIHMIIEKRDRAIAARGYAPSDYWAAFEQCCDFVPNIERWTPRLAREVEGLAEGAQLDLNEAYRLQMLDEDWFFDAYHCASIPQSAHKCTTFAVTGGAGTPTFAGQNMDIHHFVDGHQVLVRIANELGSGACLIFTYAGLMGLMGLNNAPLGINCNTLMQLGFNPTGVPVSFIVRHVLSLQTLKEAEDFLRNVPHACGQTYTLSSEDAGLCLECGPSSVVAHRPQSDRRLCHTNHPLSNGDTNQFELRNASAGCAMPLVSHNSKARLTSIQDRISDPQSPVTLDKLMQALRAKDDPKNPVSREQGSALDTNNIGFTAGSVIYEISGQPILYYAAGPPSISEFRRVSFE